MKTRACILVLGTLFFTTSSYAQISDFDSLDFTKADSVAEHYDGFAIGDQKKLAESLTRGLDTEVEKFRAIFKWVTNNISYDVDLFSESAKKKAKLRYNKKKFETWNKRFHKKILRHLKSEKSTICYGYSSLLESLCAHINIQCKTIDGYGRTSNDPIGRGSIDHAWNAVYINEKWYLCDPTWASGYVNSETDKFKRDFNRYYFLTDPQLFIANHYPKKLSWTLLYDKPTLKNFLNSPNKPSGFIANKINRYSPGEGKLKIKPDSLVRFSFTSNLPFASLKTASVQIFKKEKKVYVELDHRIYDLLLDKEGSYYFEHRLNDKGEFKIEIFVNRKLSFVYEATSK